MPVVPRLRPNQPTRWQEYAELATKHKAARELADKRAAESEAAYQAAEAAVDKHEAKLAQAPVTVEGLIKAGKEKARTGAVKPPKGYREVNKGTKHAHIVAKLGNEERKLELTQEQTALEQRMKRDEAQEHKLASELKAEKKQEAFVLKRLQAEVKLRKADEDYEHKENMNLRARLTKLELAKDYGQVKKQAKDFKEVEAKLSVKKTKSHTKKTKAKMKNTVNAKPATKKKLDNNFNDLVVPGINGRKE